jgi:hypothetical protein
MAVPKKKSIQTYPTESDHGKYMHICESLEVKAASRINDFIKREIKKNAHLLVDYKESK